MLLRLGNFQSYLGEELGPDEFVEDDDLVQIKKPKQDEVDNVEQKGEMRDANFPDSSQTSAGLPGAIMDPSEEEAAAQTMHAHL